MDSRHLKIVAIVLGLCAVLAIGYASLRYQGQERARKRLSALGYNVPAHRLRELRDLDLGGLRVTDSDLAELGYVDGLERLDLSQTGVTDAGLRSVARFSGLVSLNLDRTAVTDAGLKSVRKLRNLESLSLKHTQISDAGAAELSALTRLRELHISHTRITDRALDSLRAHRRTLQELNLIETLVTDAGLRSLNGFERLQTLYLKDTQITDRGLESVAELKDLRRLGIGNTRISDAGLGRLSSLPALETLYLDRTAITDRGLAALANLRTLTLINVAQTKSTAAGAAALRRHLPRIGIVLDQAGPAEPTLASASPTRSSQAAAPSEAVTRVTPQTPRTYVPKLKVAFSEADYPPSARSAGLGWVSVGVRLTISPRGSIDDVKVLHVLSAKEGPVPHEAEFASAAQRLFRRAIVANPPGGATAVTYDTRVVFKLN